MLALQPPTTLSGFSGAPDTLRAMVQAAQGDRGERSMLVRSVTEEITKDLIPKDYLGEILAIRNWVAENVRYMNDSLHVEIVKDPERIIEEWLERGVAVGDCFPEGTLVLREGHRLTPIESLRAGERIWGLDRWSTVEAVAYKGLLPVTVLSLNNGSELHLTEDHHIYALVCPRHSLPEPGTTTRKPCHCPTAERTEERVRVSDARVGMTLPQPERIPFGCENLDPDDALVEGFYISDGWSEAARFCISGQDGCPKEAQKRIVEEICKRRGVPTRWHRKYIAVNDREWAERMHHLGLRAPEKRVRTLDLQEGPASALIRGVMADSARHTNGQGRTLTTTSRRLAVEMRVLHRMFGLAASWSMIERHGGLGKNPIWRLGVRQRARGDGSASKPLRIKSIARQVYEARCWDIQTDDHRVYLPEHDVTVSQCDDIATLIATMALQLGRLPEYVVAGFGEPGHFSHVFVRVLEPKSNKWIVCDPVAGTNERQMLSRVTTYETWSLDE